ncbi:MAG: hypothetical protein PVF56_06480 [Desulfobacterales bacterium]|jgi:hypothetical protein
MKSVDLGFKPKLQVLDEHQIEQIHMATLSAGKNRRPHSSPEGFRSAGA